MAQPVRPGSGPAGLGWKQVSICFSFFISLTRAGFCSSRARNFKRNNDNLNLGRDPTLKILEKPELRENMNGKHPRHTCICVGAHPKGLGNVKKLESVTSAPRENRYCSAYFLPDYVSEGLFSSLPVEPLWPLWGRPYRDL